jgi:PKHD-type hydroxylase
MRLNWQMWSGGIDQAQIDMISLAAKNLQLNDATTWLSESANTQIRSSRVGWLSSNNAIRNILWGFVSRANNDAFKFDVQNIGDIQFTEYHASEQGHYDWHIDVNWDGNEPLDRKISVTVQLSDPKDYEGGDFQFQECETPDASAKVKGTVLVFPSYLKHRVLPVTSGVRQSLVAWFEGPRWR